MVRDGFGWLFSHMRDKREKLENVQDLEKKTNNDKLPYQSDNRDGRPAPE